MNHSTRCSTSHPGIRFEILRMDARRRSRWFMVTLCAALLMGVLAAVPALAQEKKDSCVDCHSQMGGPLGDAATAFKGDIHQSRGLSCADCHGGDPTQDDPGAAMDRRKGFVGAPKPQQIPAFCGRCHSNADAMKKFNPALRVDQESEYYTSVHGKRLKEGDSNVATCVSCHNAHGVQGVKDPVSSVYPLNVAETCAKCHGNSDYMKSYPIPHDQYDKYKRSVHAQALYVRQDLSAPTCNDCHGNHGAAPPGVASVANVCGQCHVRQSELFVASPHKPVFDAMQVGECLQCHSNHEILAPSDEMIGVGPKSVCLACHTQGDNGFATAQKVRGLMDTLVNRTHAASEILDRAERAGMEVSRPKFDLSEARDDLTHARVLVHSFSAEEVEKVVKPGLDVADKSFKSGQAALAELRFRREGLAISLFFIVFLVALVYLKIRQIEGKNKSATGV